MLADISVIGLDNNIKYSTCIDDKWNAFCFYSTNDKSVIVYTARFSRTNNKRIKWALHQFSSTNQFKQARKGVLKLPSSIIFPATACAYLTRSSQVMLRITEAKEQNSPYIS